MEHNSEALSLPSLLSRAPGNPLIWTQFLDTLTRQSKCDAALLLASDLKDSSNTRLLFSAFVPKDYRQLYETELNRLDKFNQYICSKPGHIFYNQRVSFPATHSGDQADFVDLARQQHRLGVSIPCTNRHVLSLLLSRRRIFDDAELCVVEPVLRALLPHLNEAIHAEQQIKIKTQLRQSSGEHFDTYLIIDSELNVIHEDAVFAAISHQMECISVVERRFGIKNPALEQQLKASISKTEHATLPNQCQSCLIRLIPIQSLKNLYPWECYQGCFVITLTHDRRENPSLSRLIELHSLSHCEAIFALQFIRTPSVADIANTTYRSQETVRNHLKHVMKKMDVHSQAELMKKLITLASL